MATSHNYVTPMCSFHNDTVAKAVCLKNKELLCFQCALNKARLDDYTVQEIDKISDGKDGKDGKEKLILEYILMKQIASKKENLIVEYESKVGEIADNLEQQVAKLYEQLAEQLSKMKEKTLSSVESKKDSFLKDFYSNKKELDGVEKTIDENLEKLSASTETDVNSLNSQLEEVKKKLIDEIADHDSNPEGDFIANHILQETMKTKDVLGDVTLFNVDHYQRLTQDEGQSSNEPYMKSATDIKPPKIPPKPDVFSDEYHERPKIIPRVAETKTKSVNDENSTMAPKRTPSGDMTNTQTYLNIPPTTEQVAEPKRKSRFRLFSGTKENSKGAVLENYVDVTFVPKKTPKAKYLINKTLHLSGLQAIAQPCKFSKLITIAPDRIGLLSTEHSYVAVAQLDGNVQIEKKYPCEVKSITAMENDQIALLTQGERTKIETIRLTDDGFETKGTIEINVELSEITGFDYSKPRFAVSSKSKLVVIDGKGKKVKSIDIAKITGMLDIAITYDFEKDCIYVLNMEQKSIKCVSLKGLTSVWKRKCDDQEFLPKSFCLYNDKLCVASSGTITIFAAKDGTPERKHPTIDLVKDCLGICAMDDVLVISSNSENIEQSGKLGFIGI